MKLNDGSAKTLCNYFDSAATLKSERCSAAPLLPTTALPQFEISANLPTEYDNASVFVILPTSVAPEAFAAVHAPVPTVWPADS